MNYRHTPKFKYDISLSYTFSFFLSCHDDHRDLHSFPTRRSSDLFFLFVIAESGSTTGLFSAMTKPLRPSPLATLNVRAARSSSDRKSTRLNSSHSQISYAVFCLKKKKNTYYESALSRA